MILDLLHDSYYSLNPNVFKFRTNATSFKINYEIGKEVTGYYPHFGITAREGLMVLHRFADEDIWYNLDAFARFPTVTGDMTYITDGKRLYDVLIYGPNLTTLDKLEIEISDEFHGEILDTSSPRKMMVLGGLNSFGIGCTTSGLFFSNILQRTFDCEMKRVVYNEINYLEKIHDYLNNGDVPHVDVSILEVDYVNQNDTYVERYLDEIVNMLQNHSNYVICWLTIPENKAYKRQKVKELLNDKSVIFKDLSYIYEDFSEMCTYSWHFLNDSANIFIFKSMKKTVSEVTNWNI